MAGHLHGPACAHESGNHEHVDVAARVALARRRSGTFAALTAAVAGVMALPAVVAGAWLPLVVAVTGWVAASAAGAATLHVGGRRGRRPAVMVAAAVITALVTTAYAAWLAGVWGREAWPAGVGGWALAAAAFQAVQSVVWRRSLLTPGQFGEFARDQAVHAASPRWAARLAWWVLPALAFGLWVWLVGLVPVAVVLVAMASIALQLLLARRNVGGAA